MEDSKQIPLGVGSRAVPGELQNGLEEQQQMLDRLSGELDDYFSLKSIRGLR